MIGIFRKSAVDLRKNARDRSCIALRENRW
jgi:hypothetical protein